MISVSQLVTSLVLASTTQMAGGASKTLKQYSRRPYFLKTILSLQLLVFSQMPNSGFQKRGSKMLTSQKRIVNFRLKGLTGM